MVNINNYILHPAVGGNNSDGVLSAIGYQFEPQSYTYTSRDVILFALGGKRSCAHTTMVGYSYL